MNARLVFAVLVMMTVGATSLYAQGPRWGTPQRDHCTSISLRQHSARLWNISGTWEVACATTPNTVAGQFFSRPTRCVNKGAFGMWGEFDVSDTTCPSWGPFQDDGCVGAGRHQFSAVLHEIPSNMTWASACAARSATVRGQFFSRPTRCVNKGVFGMWGEFDASDTTCSNPDVVQFTQAGINASVGIVLDGETDGPVSLNDASFLETSDGSRTATFNVGPIVRSSATNEVIAFSDFNAPTYLDTPWTIARDTFGVPVDGLIATTMTMWILAGPFPAQNTTVALAVARCGAIWQSERAGLRFSTVTIRDATANPLAGRYLVFPFAAPFDINTLQRDIGFDPGRLNVYWVNTVDGGTGNGTQFDGTPIALMGRNASGGLLAHELGHAFVLEHVGASFDANNVMIQSTNARQFLTEGQIFRMHFHPSSAVNFLYRARPGRPTRVCSASTADGLCLSNSKRLWADGNFPPN
jgi:hypothetical protein